jgi:NADPH:quinone reductase
MTRRIRAVRLTSHSEPVSVSEVDLPEPGPDEVVVELISAGVNPVDGYGARGLVAPDAPMPRTLGGEASGLLDGRPVLVGGGGLGTVRDGVWAEAIVTDRRFVHPLPEGVDLIQAACLGVAGVTAWNTVVTVGEVGPGDRVLVLGAGGGVGLAIVSLALSRGATVVGQVGTASKAQVVGSYGADSVVADGQTLAAQVKDFAPTVVIDPLGGAFTPAALEVLAPRGRLVIYGTSAGTEAELALRPLYRSSQRILGYGGLGLTDDERAEGARQAVAALASGDLRIHVGRVLALTNAGRVFDELADRSLAGKLVIDCQE